MSLIVEDGTIVAGAESYVNATYFTSFATKRGLTVPEDPPAIEALLIKAMDFLEGLTYIGRPVDPVAQALKWPRQNAYVDNTLLSDTSIPTAIKLAQCQLAFTAQTIDLQPSLAANAKGNIQTESVYGAVSRTYFQKAGPALTPYLSSVNALLKPYVIGGLGIGAINCVAVRA